MLLLFALQIFNHFVRLTGGKAVVRKKKREHEKAITARSPALRGKEHGPLIGLGRIRPFLSVRSGSRWVSFPALAG
jgi:hypothetical protein